MTDIGILLYGYGPEDAREIGRTLEGVLSVDLEVIGASGREESLVAEVIESPGQGGFREAEPKVLMVLGFTDEQLEATLKGFPRREGLARPIFCVLTHHNAHWPVSRLIEDLVEERRQFQQLRQQQGDGEEGEG